MLVGPRCLHLRRTSRSRFLALKLRAAWLKQALAHQDPPISPYGAAVYWWQASCQGWTLALHAASHWSFPLLEDGWGEVPTPGSMLGVIAGCMCPSMPGAIAGCRCPSVVCAIPGCMSPLVVCVIPGCICDSVARGCWQHVSFVGTPAAAHSWGLDTYAKSHFLGILRQLKRNWQAQDINDSERPSLKTCLFAWQLAACPIKTQRGTSPAGEPSFHLAESNPSPNRTCIYRHCPSSITHFQIPPRFPLSSAHLFRLLLEGTTGCVTFCGECQRKQGKTN